MNEGSESKASLTKAQESLIVVMNVITEIRKVHS